MTKGLAAHPVAGLYGRYIVMKRWNLILATVLAFALLAAGAAAFAAGGSDDPLVSLSYLNKVFAPAVYEKVDKAVQDNEAALKASLDSAIDAWDKKLQSGQSGQPSQSGDSASFQVVTLSKGQTLTGHVGCEVMLRVGSAACVSDSAPGLIDTTGGTTLNHGGALQTNHLYMVTIETRGVKAVTDTVKVLARGSYVVQ